ncbi:unnamed protein product [Caenorhabditis nigoni]
MNTVLLHLAFIVYCDYQFSCTGKQQIVDAHNDLRSSIAKGTYVAKGATKPRGADILKMEWDSSLEASAQKYADSCLWGPSGADGFGQNIHVEYAYEPVGDLDSGNKSNETIYMEGDTCSACPLDTECDEDSGLCV